MNDSSQQRQSRFLLSNEFGRKPSHSSWASKFRPDLQHGTKKSRKNSPKREKKNGGEKERRPTSSSTDLEQQQQSWIQEELGDMGAVATEWRENGSDFCSTSPPRDILLTPPRELSLYVGRPPTLNGASLAAAGSRRAEPIPSSVITYDKTFPYSLNASLQYHPKRHPSPTRLVIRRCRSPSSDDEDGGSWVRILYFTNNILRFGTILVQITHTKRFWLAMDVDPSGTRLSGSAASDHVCAFPFGLDVCFKRCATQETRFQFRSSCSEAKNLFAKKNILLDAMQKHVSLFMR